MQRPQPASWRYLVPSIENSTLSPAGVAIDWLTRCYRAVVTLNGVEILGEYYWATRPGFIENNIDPKVMWDDDDWRIPCGRKIQLTKGINPCVPTTDPQPAPDSWTNPEILGSESITLAANDGVGNLWWY